jgi:4-hydroxybenzoate polyprenyltransferase
VKEIFKLVRINNWIKNSFIFIPLFFSSELFDTSKLVDTFIVFIGFCLTTSFVYIINDIFDKDFDLNHPIKSKRPIASGIISIKFALFIGITFLFLGLIIISSISISSFYISLFYVILNFAYSLKLKQIAIIDFVVVSFGFVLRLLIGSMVSDIELTQWIVIMVFLLSLFIAIAKRRDDVYIFENQKKINRKVVSQYSISFMDKSITIISSILIMSYLLFISSSDVIERYNNSYLYITFIPVLIGILRYNQIVYVFNKASSPIKLLLKDTFLQICLLSWILMFAFIIYKSILL